MVDQDPNDSLPVAAVDLGSNSFHLIIGRVLRDELSVVDRMRDPVRLAAGLDEKRRLSQKTVDRMLASLERFRQLLSGIDPSRVRAVGTNTLRLTRRPADLLERASAALGYPIEVLSGPEEARLIYLGVSHDATPTDERRLVVDIGGGSTECILGAGFRPIFTESLQMGCVSFSQRWFPRGELTRKGFQQAEIAAKLELETMERRFRSMGWVDCLGSSGTINAVGTILAEAGWAEPGITLAGLKRLRKALISAGKLEALKLPGLQAERAPVLAGGVAILKAIFESLEIESMRTSNAALREGLLYDLLGRIRREDVRDRTIRALSERYHVDEEQAARIEATALACLAQVADDWKIDREEGRQLLSWAAKMHEIGLAIAYSGYHKHGAYILTHSILPGFSRDEQARLAAIVRGHRRRVPEEVFTAFPAGWREEVWRLCLLLRISVRLNRMRSSDALPSPLLRAKADALAIEFPEGWLEAHPLTRADLEEEAGQLAAGGVRLEFS